MDPREVLMEMDLDDLSGQGEARSERGNARRVKEASPLRIFWIRSNTCVGSSKRITTLVCAVSRSTCAG